MDKIATKRLSYEHQGRKIYEWEQTLEEIHVFIEVPPGVKAKMLDIKIDAKRLRVGLRGNPPFIDVRAATRVQKSLMLERFQAENPGFDFSGASFNGQVPDPKSFMGGVGYNTPN
ncbi:nudc domain-containing protein 2 [Chrysochromulina tobinii]|uniref:Nudc domain-containing protein 2 n=1 Tax=Chrysochromulina tobinii TaxID=1460289 RepID=A0A0M0J8P9_9EUKA|nr:nudc domain-containing protein 2 [Chrysochromulina tobinii]|eukprot:KOO22944.1 nudc domain-containing protein 2 [Chrysochromulina sp. CCMP291]